MTYLDGEVFSECALVNPPDFNTKFKIEFLDDMEW